MNRKNECVLHWDKWYRDRLEHKGQWNDSISCSTPFNIGYNGNPNSRVGKINISGWSSVEGARSGSDGTTFRILVLSEGKGTLQSDYHAEKGEANLCLDGKNSSGRRSLAKQKVIRLIFLFFRESFSLASVFTMTIMNLLKELEMNEIHRIGKVYGSRLKKDLRCSAEDLSHNCTIICNLHTTKYDW